MPLLTPRTVIGALSLALALGSAAVAPTGAGAPAAAPTGPAASGLSANVAALTRDTKWELTGRLDLRFPTHHPQGMAIVGDRIFLSSVEIIEPTVKFPAPQGGYDRTPGKGVGHLFVLDRQGALLHDIVLGEGDAYHPGGIDFDGTNVWVPVAEYRPNSSALVYKVDATTLAVTKEFEVRDHIGGLVMDRVTGHLAGVSWGSRRLYEWTAGGRQVEVRDNPGFFIDYQDCQYAETRQMVCGGVAGLPQTPAAGGGSYELGGLALIDLGTGQVAREVPFPQFSRAGHVTTRNPVELVPEGDRLTAWTAPDDGDEGAGTELLTYTATVR